MENIYKVIIKTPNAILSIRNKQFRTPAEIEDVTEPELNLLKLQIAKYSLESNINIIRKENVNLMVDEIINQVEGPEDPILEKHLILEEIVVEENEENDKDYDLS